MRFILVSLLACSSASMAQTPSPAQSVPPLQGCTSEESRQFDFWVGEWDVYPNGTKNQVAHSRIENLYVGCAIRENWMPLRGAGGGSLNSFDLATKKWHQTWIGSQPGRVEFVGGYSGEKMVLTGNWPGLLGPGQDALIRMTYSREDNNAVRQHGEQSTDYGLTWTTSFDFIYRKRLEPLP